MLVKTCYISRLQIKAGRCVTLNPPHGGRGAMTAPFLSSSYIQHFPPPPRPFIPSSPAHLTLICLAYLIRKGWRGGGPYGWEDGSGDERRVLNAVDSGAVRWIGATPLRTGQTLPGGARPLSSRWFMEWNPLPRSLSSIWAGFISTSLL